MHQFSSQPIRRFDQSGGRLHDPVFMTLCKWQAHPPFEPSRVPALGSRSCGQ
jgi:hypothetical protein